MTVCSGFDIYENINIYKEKNTIECFNQNCLRIPEGCHPQEKN